MPDNWDPAADDTLQAQRLEDTGGTTWERGQAAGEGLADAAALLRGDGEERYQIGRELGHGAMGAVFEARDVNIRRSVALKLITGAGAVNPSQALRFVEEAQITGQLEHSAIIPVYGARPVS